MRARLARLMADLCGYIGEGGGGMILRELSRCKCSGKEITGEDILRDFV